MDRLSRAPDPRPLTPDPRPLARVHIVGGPGSGKTTLARRIAAEIGAPVFDLDEVAFEIATGRPRSRKERLADLDRILTEPSWVTEGVFLWWTDPLLTVADQVIWLDTRWPVALWRIVRRHIRASRAGTNRYPGIRRLLGFLAWAARYYLTPFAATPRTPDDDAALSRRATARHLMQYRSTLVTMRQPILAGSGEMSADRSDCLSEVDHDGRLDDFDSRQQWAPGAQLRPPSVRFEPLQHRVPDLVHARHPREPLAIMSVQVDGSDAAGIWNIETGRLVWAADGTEALAWNIEGDQIVAVRTAGWHDWSPEDRLSSALRYDNNQFLERYTWPDWTRLSSCPITYPSGWTHGLTMSPTGDLAVVTWLEQDCAGFILVELTPSGDRQLKDRGYQARPNLCSSVVFSPKGDTIVAAYGRNCWWSDDDWNTPSLGGILEVGHVAIYTIADQSVREITLTHDVPVGWLPDEPEDIAWELPGLIEFLSATEFSLEHPKGIRRRFRTDTFSKEDAGG